jgi:hypothetical protein
MIEHTGATQRWVAVLQSCASKHAALVKQHPAFGACPHDVGKTVTLSHALFAVQVIHVPLTQASPVMHCVLVVQQPYDGT